MDHLLQNNEQQRHQIILHPKRQNVQRAKRPTLSSVITAEPFTPRARRLTPSTLAPPAPGWTWASRRPPRHRRSPPPPLCRRRNPPASCLGLKSSNIHDLATVAALRMMVTAYCSVASYASREKPMVRLLHTATENRYPDIFGPLRQAPY